MIEGLYLFDLGTPFSWADLLLDGTLDPEIPEFPGGRPIVKKVVDRRRSLLSSSRSQSPPRSDSGESEVDCLMLNIVTRFSFFVGCSSRSTSSASGRSSSFTSSGPFTAKSLLPSSGSKGKTPAPTSTPVSGKFVVIFCGYFFRGLMEISY